MALFLCPGSLHMHKCTRICCLLVYESNLGSTNVPVTTNPTPSASLFSASFLSWKPKVSKQSSLISPVHPFIKHKETDCRIDCAACEPSGTTNRIKKKLENSKAKERKSDWSDATGLSYLSVICCCCKSVITAIVMSQKWNPWVTLDQDVSVIWSFLRECTDEHTCSTGGRKSDPQQSILRRLWRRRS